MEKITQKDPNRENTLLYEPPVQMPEPPRSPAMKCPHCSADPIQIGIHIITFGGGMPVAAFVCSVCRCVLGTSIIPPMPQVMEPRNESRLVIP